MLAHGSVPLPVWFKRATKPGAMIRPIVARIAASLTATATLVGVAADGSSATRVGAFPLQLADVLHRPLHLPRLKPGQRCPVTRPSRTVDWRAAGQQLNGRGPAYLVVVTDPASGTISINQSARDSLGWYGQKTPWVIERTYDGAVLVRGARIGRPGQVRFAHSYGQHLRELHWDAGSDAGLPPDPTFRFLPSATLFRVAGCYAFQIDGTSFTRIIVVRVRR